MLGMQPSTGLRAPWEGVPAPDASKSGMVYVAQGHGQTAMLHALDQLDPPEHEASCTSGVLFPCDPLCNLGLCVDSFCRIFYGISRTNTMLLQSMPRLVFLYPYIWDTIESKQSIRAAPALELVLWYKGDGQILHVSTLCCA
jgi:hypothetical protein